MINSWHYIICNRQLCNGMISNYVKDIIKLTINSYVTDIINESKLLK